MAFAIADTDLASWRECRDCGLFQTLPPVELGEAVVCSRCDAMLRRATPHSVLIARVCAVLSAALLLFAFARPFVELRVVGRFATSTLVTGPQRLGQDGMPVLALAVLATLVVLPAARIAIELAVFFGALAPRPPRWLAWLFGWLDVLTPWAMIEVFLLGAIVAYTRLQDLASVHVGDAVWALGGVMLATVTIDATLDHEEVWRALEKGAPGRASSAGELPAATHRAEASAPPAPQGGPDGAIGCDRCGRVSRASVGDPCPRCGHRLRVRGGALSRVWALVLTAGLLYIPANVLPVMTVKRLGKGGPSTIVNGVGELAANHLWPLAVIVLLASIVVPVVKIASLVTLLVLTHRGSPERLRARTRLFRFVHFIGRWSMIDIFMLTTLVGVVNLGFLATVLPGLGAVAFCCVVLLTMAATEAFDPRLMWDAGRRSAS
jgi:paraquat-inducible protein A